MSVFVDWTGLGESNRRERNRKRKRAQKGVSEFLLLKTPLETVDVAVKRKIMDRMNKTIPRPACNSLFNKDSKRGIMR
jgi:hypothetical protein